LGGKELPLVLDAAGRYIYFCVFVHDRVLVHDKATKKKSPAEGPPGIVEFIPRSSDQGRKSRWARMVTAQLDACASAVVAPPKA
jgi:hypothetical protein